MIRRFIPLLAAAGLLTLTLPAFAENSNSLDIGKNNTVSTNAVSVSPGERAKIEEVVHQYLIQKPEVLVEALQVLQRKQYQQAEISMKKTQQAALSYANSLFNQSSDPIAGNPNGKVTVVEFFDYQCPHCIDMAPVVDAIVKSDPNVRIVYKDFPIRGAVSEYAARAALAANKQGKYLILYHALLSATQPLTQDAVLQIAKNNGINVDQLQKDMNDPAISKQLKDNLKLAQDLKLFGTPAFFIGKTEGTTAISYYPGQLDQVQLQTLINKSAQ